MKRPWQVWLAFVVCVVGAATAMAWMTQQALRTDELRRAAEAETELEQRVSLALWRMDTELAPIIAAEVIRPPSDYRSPVESAPNTPAAMMPAKSAAPPEFVLLQFEARPDGTWHSPQLPDEEASARCEQLSQTVGVPVLTFMCPSTPLPSAEVAGENYLALKSAKSAEEWDRLERQLQFVEGNPSAQQGQEVQEPVPSQDFEQRGKPQLAKSADFEKRSLRYQNAAQLNLINQERGRGPQTEATADDLFGGPDDAAPQPEQIGVSRPLWLGSRLILARRVVSSGETAVQGCWLDWESLKGKLLAEVVDLLPDADLVAVPDDAAADPGRMLAGLPVRLVVGPASANAVSAALGPTLRWALWMGWGALALATAAAAALLAGVIGLSERRAAFVSSVTHELRTPLTTFRMYSEMLSRGMVPDAERRQEYLQTLERESERLTLLVENVLAYARLERGRRPQVVDHVSVADLLDRIGPRLAQRAAQAGMECKIDVDDTVGAVEIATDANVVEQILFNLVDNAAKYAVGATDLRIHLDASRTNGWVQLAVRDHGPGIDSRRWSRRMQAFGKSAEESAESAPGVGLGLALCRRLARQLGGRLDVAVADGGGARLTLSLPV